MMGPMSPPIALDREYRELVEAHRAELHAHCYRMLGSVHDAEDALQDALLRAWRGLGRFEGRSSRRTWLYRIATNACLDVIGRRSRRALPMDLGPATEPGDGLAPPLVESVFVEPYPDDALATAEEREGVELAFVAAIQHLAPRQRAVLILRDVLGFSAREVAEALDSSVASVNSALQRAHAAVDERLPERTQQATLRALGDDGLRDLVGRYTEAWERGDVDGIVALLAEDAVITMPPMPTWFSGRAAVAAFLRDVAFARRWDPGAGRFVEGERDVRLLPARASGQVALASFRRPPGGDAHVAQALQVLTLRGDRVTEVHGFVTPALFGRFGLPDALPAPG
jgi:RNA polymerase sigma-70 factor (ECF subfamily)